MSCWWWLFCDDCQDCYFFCTQHLNLDVFISFHFSSFFIIFNDKMNIEIKQNKCHECHQHHDRIKLERNFSFSFRKWKIDEFFLILFFHFWLLLEFENNKYMVVMDKRIDFSFLLKMKSKIKKKVDFINHHRIIIIIRFFFWNSSSKLSLKRIHRTPNTGNWMKLCIIKKRFPINNLPGIKSIQ